MTTDLDRALAEDLRARADSGSPIDPQPLLTVAVARGRRFRTRRHAATAVLTLAALAVPVVLWPRELTTPSVDPTPASSAMPHADLAKLPTVAGLPGASTRPDLVGADRGLLHFSVDPLARAAYQITWTSEPGVETANIQREDVQVYVALSRTAGTLPGPAFSRYFDAVMGDPVETVVGGRPAELRVSRPSEAMRTYAFVWQPVDGLWARVETRNVGGQERAQQLLGLVRFDQAKRCAAPVRLTHLPPTAAVTACSVSFHADSPAGFFASVTTTVADGERRLTITSDAAHPGSGEYPRPLRAGPYRVFADPNGRTWTIRTKDLFILAHTEDRFTRAEVFRILAGLRIAEQLHDPTRW